jgi:hypothetical protein
MQQKYLGANPVATVWDFWSDRFSDWFGDGPNGAWNRQYSVPQRELDEVADDHTKAYQRATAGKWTAAGIAQEQSAYQRNVNMLGQKTKEEREAKDHTMLILGCTGLGLLGLVLLSGGRR